MVCQWCIGSLFFAAAALADYYVDNANTSVIYSMAPSASGVAWQTFSVSTQSLTLSISNSTGNYSIPIDASKCYDDNYALGVCGDGDNCFVQIPFTGSGITMYVLSAGFSGITASFSVDGAPATSNTIPTPPGPTFQTPNVSMYEVQNLPTGNHTMVMTVLNWSGSASSMKFDYAFINETFVAEPATTSATSVSYTSSASQSPSQSPTGNLSNSSKVDLGGVIGGTLAGIAVVVAVVLGVIYFRRRKTTSASVPPHVTHQTTAFMSEYSTSPPPQAGFATYGKTPFHRQADGGPSIPPLTRSAILREALAAGSHPPSEPLPSSRSTMSGESSGILQPLRRQPSIGFGTDRPGSSSYPDALPPSVDASVTSRYNLTVEQLEVIDRLRADNVPPETIARVAEGFVSGHGYNQSSADISSGGLTRGGSIFSAAPPPSYQTRYG
ncbi:hypothetical protein BS17DRAFT_772381 [Gyrodon lividus]|nr:hypothetical protein BS17DRAFT_772381 [Gyrodon lividus]